MGTESPTFLETPIRKIREIRVEKIFKSFPHHILLKVQPTILVNDLTSDEAS